MPESDTTTTTTTTDDAGKGDQTGTQTSTSTTGDEPLGEKGVLTLEKERDARKLAEREAKATKAELEKLRKEHQTEQEKALEEAVSTAKAEVLTEANKRVLRAEVRAAAAGKMNPGLAVKLLDLDDFDVDDNGEVDGKAIAKAIDQLIKDTPGLATNGDGKNTRGSADGGARGGGGGGQSMNDLIRNRMR